MAKVPTSMGTAMEKSVFGTLPATRDEAISVKPFARNKPAHGLVLHYSE